MSLIAWVFTAYVVFYLPFVAWRSVARVSSGAELPPRRRMYLSSGVLQVVVLLLAVSAAGAERIELFPWPVVGLPDALVGLGWVGIKFARFEWMFHRAAARRSRRMLQHLGPRTIGETAAFVAMVALAAVAEEAAYRGVLFQLAERASGSFWLAGIGSAVVFGLAHLTQGQRPALMAGVLGLGNQVVVLLTGSLWVAIAAHFAYDVLVGLVVGRRGRRIDAGLEDSGPAMQDTVG